MDFRIAGKVAFVAGGSKGMGREAALALAAEGCKVLIVARGQEAIDAAVADIRSQGGTAQGVSADLTSREGINKALDICRSHWDMPDIVVSQTKQYHEGRAIDMDPEQVEDIRAPLLLHYAGLDERINAGIDAFRNALDAAGKEYTIHIYEGVNHAFNNDTSEARYDKEAADLAWRRTVDFFKEKLG